MAHPVMWFEVMGGNGPMLREFYGKLFGWTYGGTVPSMDYAEVKTGDGRGIPGGIGTAPAGTPHWVTFYTETSSVAASLDKAVALGGQVVMPRTELPGQTIIALFADPEGHVLGLVEHPAAQ